MGLALYRKYRSKSLDDIVGQDHIKQVLKSALKTNKLRHAYLFTGPRGVGKTSIARILAHEINNLPYNEDTTHLDIIEIDAASNRRIDEIRDLRDKVHIAPTSSKYKVYIIDEVHMLTKEAFNALLKTLEEPPEHVIFILATTEAHKVPDTILSRTQRFTFRPVPGTEAVTYLAKIAKKEDINIDTASLERIVDHAQGSLRDSLNMLDQMRSIGKTITVDSVTDLLGIPGDETVLALVDAALNGQAALLIKLLETSRIAGHNAPTLALRISNQIRVNIIAGSEYSSELIQLLEKLLMVPQSQQPFVALELALLSYAAQQSSPGVEAHTTTHSTQEQGTPVATISQSASQQGEITSPMPLPQPTLGEPEIQKTVDSVPTVSNHDIALDSEWEVLLAKVKSTHNTLYSVLRMAKPKLQGNELNLVFNFAFHQKQVESATQKEVISAAAASAYGKSIIIKTSVAKENISDKPVITSKAQAKLAESNQLKDISNIFEGAELLE